MRQKQSIFSLFLLSPSSRRAWIEISSRGFLCTLHSVALLAEGVDRNLPDSPILSTQSPSPSSRRAWIEIISKHDTVWTNRSPSSRRAWIEINQFAYISEGIPVALLAEGVDRNINKRCNTTIVKKSPSSRRAWIEIVLFGGQLRTLQSPSSRRAWIEILFPPQNSA